MDLRSHCAFRKPNKINVLRFSVPRRAAYRTPKRQIATENGKDTKKIMPSGRGSQDRKPLFCAGVPFLFRFCAWP